MVVEGRRRQKIAYAENIPGRLGDSLSVVRLGHSIYYGILSQTEIEVELENEPLESAVSSPHVRTHHG